MTNEQKNKEYADSFPVPDDMLTRDNEPLILTDEMYDNLQRQIDFLQNSFQQLESMVHTAVEKLQGDVGELQQK